MPTEVVQVQSRSDLRKFIFLPEKIHSSQPNWIPPIYMDEWRYFNPKKNPAYSYCDTVLVLAKKNGDVVGRIMGIINHRYNEFKNEKTGRFCYLECWDDQEVAHALLGYVETWAKERGMNKTIGPYGFSDQDPEGFLIEGFEHIATIATYYNDEYMLRLLAKEGYTKDVDYFVYKTDVPEKIPEFYERINERLQRNQAYRIVEFTKRKQLKPQIHPIFNLMNECFSEIYGYAPLDEIEMQHLAKRYYPVMDPRFVKVVYVQDEIIGFIIGIPCLSEGIKASKGHLLPFGLIKIIRAAKKTKQLDLLLGGIKKEYQGKGIDVLMGIKMIQSAQKSGYEFFDSHHELESNTKMRAENEKMGGKVYKKYRVFQKALV